MTEQEMRELVREVIASRTAPSHPRTVSHHQLLFMLPSGADGSCIIEPAVTCNHCGYCKSYGH